MINNWMKKSKNKELEVFNQVEHKQAKSNCCKTLKNWNLLIRANDSWKFWWDIIILLFALFNSVTIPMSLAFDEIDESFKNSTMYSTIDAIGNAFFFMDIMLQMNTTYYDSDGEEIFNKGKIRYHYLTGMFIVDLLSSLPIELAVPVSTFNLIILKFCLHLASTCLH